ncbi:hypothetical protein TIFTF001_029694 [Ficus carica]|uniref:Uncharacterized protein n=1 Tax=Ficus carica TaxID=3494 RepID=A0AA88DWC2_FICCA|nr:hypothetical protein TIFTF001_029694 [Ficus carica]
MLRSRLDPGTRAALEEFIMERKDVFAWSHADIPGIDPAVMCHQPSIEREEVFCSENVATWMDPIVRYLTESQLPENREEAWRVRNTSARSYDQAPTRIGRARPGPTCPRRHPNLCGSWTTEFSLMTGYLPKLDVPNQDLLPLQASQPVVLGPQS